MQVKYTLKGGTRTYSGNCDIYLTQMNSGYNEQANMYWIGFPSGFEYRTNVKDDFFKVRDALVSILTCDNDEAIIDGIGSIESGPELDHNLRSSSLSTGMGFFSNSRVHITPSPEQLQAFTDECVEPCPCEDSHHPPSSRHLQTTPESSYPRRMSQ